MSKDVSSMKFREVEFKYSASNIQLRDFHTLIAKLNPRMEQVSSFDDYFVNNEGNFLRYRYSNNEGQLTTKRKTSGINNNNRIEYNVDLASNNYDTISGFCKLLGYEHNFKIFKNCFIAWLDKVDLVFYLVYDEDMKEVGRYLEIEALESYPWTSEDEAWNELLKYEELLKPLGISAQHRMRKSLFEIFRK